MTNIEQYLTEETKFISAVVGFLVEDDKVLLGLRKKVSLNLGHNLVSGIGGKVGDEAEYAHETNEEALVRECIEEIGVEPTEFINVGRVRFIWTHHPERNMDVAIYLIHEWIGEPIETEAIKPQWYDKDELPKEQMWEDNVGLDESGWVPLVLNGLITDAIVIYGEDGRVVDKVINYQN